MSGAVEVAGARLGFAVVPGRHLAGGLVEVEFSATATGEPVYLAYGGDRSRGRPAWFDFPATYDGVRLADPFAAAPELGGPSTAVELGPTPFRQTLLLNEFVTLEQTAGRGGELRVRCLRRPTLGSSAEEAMVAPGEPVSVELVMELEHDQTALEALVDSLVASVWAEGAGADLPRLLSLRGFVDRWRELGSHPDAAVRERVSGALRQLGR